MLRLTRYGRAAHGTQPSLANSHRIIATATTAAAPAAAHRRRRRRRSLLLRLPCRRSRCSNGQRMTSARIGWPLVSRAVRQQRVESRGGAALSAQPARPAVPRSKGQRGSLARLPTRGRPQPVSLAVSLPLTPALRQPLLLLLLLLLASCLCQSDVSPSCAASTAAVACFTLTPASSRGISTHFNASIAVRLRVSLNPQSRHASRSACRLISTTAATAQQQRVQRSAQ